MLDNTTGSFNSAFGGSALASNTTGNDNIAVGFSAGQYISGGSIANRTSGWSVYLGTDTMPLASGDVNEIVIGYNAAGGGSNTATIGNSSVTRWFFGTHSMTWGAAPPSSGTWAKGDICWNTEVTASTSAGWICTTAGTPGTWTAMPNLRN